MERVAGKSALHSDLIKELVRRSASATAGKRKRQKEHETD